MKGKLAEGAAGLSAAYLALVVSVGSSGAVRAAQNGRSGATWSTALPPKPDHWEHLLDAVNDSNRLDPDRFAKIVRTYLAQLIPEKRETTP